MGDQPNGIRRASIPRLPLTSCECSCRRFVVTPHYKHSPQGPRTPQTTQECQGPGYSLSHNQGGPIPSSDPLFQVALSEPCATLPHLVHPLPAVRLSAYAHERVPARTKQRGTTRRFTYIVAHHWNCLCHACARTDVTASTSYGVICPCGSRSADNESVHGGLHMRNTSSNEMMKRERSPSPLPRSLV